MGRAVRPASPQSELKDKREDHMKCTKTMTERLLALTLSVAMAFSAVPTQALAEVADSLESTPVEAAAEVDETTEDEQLPVTDEGEKASEAETPAETTEGGVCG